MFQLVDAACALLINMGLEDSPKFCNRPDLGRGLWPDVAINEIRCVLAQIFDDGTCAMGRRAVIAQPQTLVCTSALVAMVTVAAGTLLCE